MTLRFARAHRNVVPAGSAPHATHTSIYRTHALSLSNLEIGFFTEELRDLCEHEEHAIASIGLSAAEALHRRLADIRAAEFIDEVVAGKPSRSKIEGVACVLFDLNGEYTLAIAANHSPPRLDESGSTAWSRVRRVIVRKIYRAT